jgi:phosphatidylserine/phosphatidylglycerophosphate/cardiolipin synthase-like enzyme
VQDGTAQVTFVASPKGYLPDERLWDLPALVRLIDSAQRSVRVQLLTYRARGGRGGDFPELEEALQRAAARGAKVELLVSDWSKRKWTLTGLQALQSPPSLTVKFFSVPPAASGFIPFARVAHAKYLVVDGARAWVGTSNWEKDYFFQSRNVGVVIDGGPLPARLDAFFAQNWESPYAELVDKARDYQAPRIGE